MEVVADAAAPRRSRSRGPPSRRRAPGRRAPAGRRPAPCRCRTRRARSRAWCRSGRSSSRSTSSRVWWVGKTTARRLAVDPQPQRGRGRRSCASFRRRAPSGGVSRSSGGAARRRAAPGRAARAPAGRRSRAPISRRALAAVGPEPLDASSSTAPRSASAAHLGVDAAGRRRLAIPSSISAPERPLVLVAPRQDRPAAGPRRAPRPRGGRASPASPSLSSAPRARRSAAQSFSSGRQRRAPRTRAARLEQAGRACVSWHEGEQVLLVLEVVVEVARPPSRARPRCRACRSRAAPWRGRPATPRRGSRASCRGPLDGGAASLELAGEGRI